MVVLGCFYFPETHEGSHIREKVENILAEYPGLSSKIVHVVRDNATNMVAAFDDSPYTHSGCFMHILHLIVTNSVFVYSSIEKIINQANLLSKFIASIHGGIHA